ncbi:MAG: PEP-CTERM sorting domain-containing protein [Phycisphaerales bacterium]|nr:PEP-CTERM sorting domain-containing protein [Phycisphaerales bacterium]
MKVTTLVAASAVISLAGVASADLVEDFNAGIPGTWTVVDNIGNGGWQTNDYYGDPNWASGDGLCAEIDSDYIGQVDVDSELISPFFLVPDGATLDFDTNYITYTGADYADTDISLDGMTWTNLLSWHGDADEQGEFQGSGVPISVAIPSAFYGQTAQIRFHYYDANWEWYWQVDNVSVVPAPSSIALLGLAGLVTRRRR